MAVRSKPPCNTCKTQGLKCDTKKPRCTNCSTNGNEARCMYPLTLKWGGRPYKDKTKRIKMPPNTRLVDGVLMATVVKKEPRGTLKRKDRKSIRESATPALENMTMVKNFGELVEDTHGIGSSPAAQSQAVAWTGQAPLPRLLKPMDLPGLVLLNSSAQYSAFFEFYVCETAHTFVPLHKDAKSNPFRTIVPRLALHSPTLMKIIMAFGGRHLKQRLRAEQEDQCYALEEGHSDLSVSSYSDKLVKNLEKQSLVELIRQLSYAQNGVDDLVLACVLLLASLCIFFSTDNNKWYTHLHGAEGIIIRELKNHPNVEQNLLKYPSEEGPSFFLRRWFAYIRVIGTLSSAHFRGSPTQDYSSLKIEFNLPTRPEKNDEMDGVFYTNGMEVTVLSFLAQVANIVLENEISSMHAPTPALFRATIDLDYKIINWLNVREMSQEDNPEATSSGTIGTCFDDKLRQHSILRATNLLFGLTGVLQLRRRVMGMTHESSMVHDLLCRMTNLIELRMPTGNNVPSCLLFCFFCCGCELIEESLAPRRKICLIQLDSLIKDGVESALHAKMIMEECWRTSKSWWEVLRERNLEICFAI
ncbi:LANO_0A05182g1_1 [Lachancea nothofagi CBS 11611]|uniref:LANO_0A05182g1_1 n=1 Tax=Lachancea nothofagi CBS 11611 TaxID=1266666 RepID=A0A1G4IRG1_9SACH|nr:LANO_0A05182g1_1 [Lachancea nothofagi CBS 11611]